MTAIKAVCSIQDPEAEEARVECPAILADRDVQDALTLVKSGDAECLVIESFSSFCASLGGKLAEKELSALIRGGRRVVLLDLGLDSAVESGHREISLFLRMRRLQARARRLRQQDQKAKLKQQALYQGGAAPYGYIAQPDGNVVPNEQEQRVVQQIRDWNESGVSISEIVRRLNREGVPSRGSKWHRNTIYRILKR